MEVSANGVNGPNVQPLVEMPSKNVNELATTLSQRTVDKIAKGKGLKQEAAVWLSAQVRNHKFLLILNHYSSTYSSFTFLFLTKSLINLDKILC